MILTMLFSCSSKSTPTQTSVNTSISSSSFVSGPQCLIYKTKADYNKHVPVILSPDKSYIASFPDIRDVYYNGQFAYPDTLAKGYLLDNKGIGPNVAFLVYTYEEYSQLEQTPRAEYLMQKILDRDPLLEMYRCGTKSNYSNISKSLNEIINSGGLIDYERLK